jgi:hypothetical protein
MTKSLSKLTGLLRRFSAVGARAQSIVRGEGGFIVRDGGRELPVQLSEIVAAEGAKVDKVTYEENFLVLTRADGTKIPIGELADGFAEFEQAISTSLNGFPKEWRVAVEREPPGKYVSLWTR